MALNWAEWFSDVKTTLIQDDLKMFCLLMNFFDYTQKCIGLVSLYQSCRYFVISGQGLYYLYIWPFLLL